MAMATDAQDYHKICEECDVVLKCGAIPLGRVAIAWLHVLNEHPSNLVRYLGAKPRILSSIVKFAGKAILLNFPNALKNTFSPRWFFSNDLPTEVDVLLVSHLLNESQATQAEDFYFGDLSQYANNMNSPPNVVTLQRLHVNISAQKAASLSLGSRVFFNPITKPHEELYFFLIQTFTFCQLLLASLNPSKHKVKSNTYRIAAAQALSSSTTDNLRFHHTMVKWFKRFKPKAVALTFEGHAWERMVIAAARQSGVKIKCTGYHHAILFPRQHAMLRGLGQYFDPDQIYFAGEVTRQAFYKKATKTLPSHVVGTHRSDAVCVELPKEKMESLTCLLLPDGTFSECLLMISFALQAAKTIPHIRFVIRLHPVVVYEDLVRNNPDLKNCPNNFELSNLSIEQDFQRSRWAVYRGSGAGVRAATAGLRPIYLQSPEDVLPIDPMIDLKNWKKAIDCLASLNVIIADDRKSSWAQLNLEFSLAHDYLSQYFIPMQHDQFFRELYA